jgi:hypothetical protein
MQLLGNVLYIERRSRIRWFIMELYKGGEYNFFSFGIGHPDKHVWWAFVAYIYWKGIWPYDAPAKGFHV